ncbi:MAG: CHC2 zinc finger domain-containing protein [Patescibacteria group bacterium]
MSNTAELIKEKLDIADFVRGYVPLTPAGKNFKGLCPFHKEKTPSFIVSPDRQAWHCFGCNQGGDAISFLMKYENLEFIEALRILAERTGVEMAATNRDERAYAALYDINRVAKDFFVANLAAETATAKGVREYLANRGLTEETIKEFEIGFAPNASDLLSRHLTKAGFSMQDIERAGLSFKTERGTYWDRFRGRVMFPITNHFGKVVAFTGRVLPSEGSAAPPGRSSSSGRESTEGFVAAKYVNSPETPIFSKSKILFGFSKSKRHIRDAKVAVLVEGQMDFLMAWQSGVKNIAASSGTATTTEHLKQLARAAETVVLAFDADEAGQVAAERVSDLAAALDLAVKIVRPDPNLKDPADIVRENPARFAEVVASAEPAIRFYLRRHLGEGANIARNDPTALKKGIRTVLSKVKVAVSPVEQAYWIREIAGVTGIPERSLLAEMAAILTVAPKTSSISGIPSPPAPEREVVSRRDRILERILSLAVAEPALRGDIEREAIFLGEPYTKVLSCIVKGEPIPGEFSELADIVSMGASIGPTGVTAVSELADLLKQLKLDRYRSERERLSMVIRAAERAGDHAALESALKEFMKISQES